MVFFWIETSSSQWIIFVNFFFSIKLISLDSLYQHFILLVSASTSASTPWFVSTTSILYSIRASSMNCNKKFFSHFKHHCGALPLQFPRSFSIAAHWHFCVLIPTRYHWFSFFFCVYFVNVFFFFLFHAIFLTFYSVLSRYPLYVTPDNVFGFVC